MPFNALKAQQRHIKYYRALELRNDNKKWKIQMVLNNLKHRDFDVIE